MDDDEGGSDEERDNIAVLPLPTYQLGSRPSFQQLGASPLLSPPVASPGGPTSVRLPSFHVPLSRPSINPSLHSPLSLQSQHLQRPLPSAGAGTPDARGPTEAAAAAMPPARTATLSDVISKSEGVVTMSNPLSTRQPTKRASMTDVLSGSARNLATYFSHSIRSLSANKSRGSIVELNAMSEHKADSKVLSLELVRVSTEYGNGPYSYLVFLLFIAAMTYVVALIASAAYGSLFSSLADTSSLAGAFTALYPSSSWSVWLGTSLAVVLIPLLGFFLYPVVHAKAIDRTRLLEGSDSSAMEDIKVDLHTISITRQERRRRRVVSAVVFVALIGVQAAITYGVLAGLSNVRSSFASLIVAAVNTALNFASRLAVKRLTVFERHKKWSTTRNADTLKIFALKLTNVVILSLLKAQVLDTNGAGGGSGAALNSDAITRLTCKSTAASASAPSSGKACTCPLLGAGWTFFWLVALDIAVSTFFSPLYFYLRFRFYKYFAADWGLSDYETKAEYDVAEEFVGVLYRFFLTLQGAAVFPMLTLIGAISYFPIKWYTDRLKLIVLCRKTVQREEPVKLPILLSCCFVTCLAVLFVYPQGLVFVALGYPGYEDCVFSKP